MRNRRDVAGRAQPSTHLESVDLGHEHVEHDGINLLGRHGPQCFAAVAGQAHLVALEGEGTPEGLPDRGLVVDDKDPHFRQCGRRT